MTFRKDELVLGGDECADVDLVIADGDLALLRVDEHGDIWITGSGRDLGTFVNGVRIAAPTKLALDDVLSFTTDEIDIGTSYVQLASAPVKSPVKHCKWQIELASRYAYPTVTQTVRGDEIVIGSALPAQLVLESDDVSPQHCVLHRVGDRYEVEDLGSELGTLVNGAPITGRVALGANDELEVGEYALKIPGPAQEVDEPVWEVTFEVHARGAIPSTLTFRKARISVGRAPENDIPLVKSRRASKRHCTIVVENGEVHVEDNGSTNSTWLNGRRIQESPLSIHDQLYVGELVIVLVAPPKRVR